MHGLQSETDSPISQSGVLTIMPVFQPIGCCRRQFVLATLAIGLACPVRIKADDAAPEHNGRLVFHRYTGYEA